MEMRKYNYIIEKNDEIHEIEPMQQSHQKCYPELRSLSNNLKIE
jgi:hypothetical protein